MPTYSKSVKIHSAWSYFSTFGVSGYIRLPFLLAQEWGSFLFLFKENYNRNNMFLIKIVIFFCFEFVDIGFICIV